MILNINGNNFKVKVVHRKEDIRLGMMRKTFDKTFNGMFFVMEDEEHCFWMKNCIIPLDIIFIQDDEIVEIFHNCEPCESENCENYCSTGNYILEVRGGTCNRLGISEGDIIEFD